MPTKQCRSRKSGRYIKCRKSSTRKSTKSACSKRRGSARRGAGGIDQVCRAAMGLNKCEYPTDWNNMDYTNQTNKEFLIGKDGTSDSLYCKVAIPKRTVAGKYADEEVVPKALSKKYPCLVTQIERACNANKYPNPKDRVKCQVKAAIQKGDDWNFDGRDFDDAVCDKDNYLNTDK